MTNEYPIGKWLVFLTAFGLCVFATMIVVCSLSDDYTTRYAACVGAHITEGGYVNLDNKTRALVDSKRLATCKQQGLWP